MRWRFWEKGPKTEGLLKAEVHKLPKPKDIPEPVGKYLVVELGKDPDWVWRLKSVVRPRGGGKDCWDVRVFDEVKATQGNVAVKDYTSLDEHPELILYEGWFDKKSMKVQVEEKKTPPIPRAA
jgi:hypothetical protein